MAALFRALTAEQSEYHDSIDSTREAYSVSLLGAAEAWPFAAFEDICFGF